VACARNKITIPIREFSSFKPRGEFTQVFPGDDTSALNEIHRNYIAGLNHGIYRDHWLDNRGWKAFIKNDPYVTGTYTYLWRDEGGKPGGYIKFQHSKNKEDNMMQVSDLAFVDRDALYGVLSIAGVMDAQFQVFQWLMPTFLDPADFVRGIWDIEQQIIPRDMTRVVNVRAALEKMRRPTGEGAYIIGVSDEFISTNQGRFLVEYSPDETRVSITQKEPDISCDIPVLSQLITGYRTLESALRTRQTGLEIHGNKETLARVFTQRPQHLTEYF
jgi:predicted acetyltransferase